MPAAPAVPLTPELIQQVLDRMESGESLRAICRDANMPELTQIMRLRRNDAEFEQQYARAREIQAEIFYDELVEIADDGSNDYMEIHHAGKDSWVENGEAVRRSVLRVDTRKWAMSKILTKRYGDRLDLNHAGEIGIKRILVPARTQTAVSTPPEAPDFGDNV